jgi:Acyltransferase family.
MKKTVLNKNSTIDALRIFLIVAIIYIHCQPLLGSLVIENSILSFVYDKVVALIVLALPIFFALSGYFLYGARSQSDKWKKFIKLLKILLWAEILYLLISFVYGGVKVSLIPFFDMNNLVNLFIGAVPIPIPEGASNLPLWYLVCLVIVSYIEWFAGKHSGKVMAIMAVVGFLIGNLHGAYTGFADNTMIIPILNRVFGTEFDYLTQGFLYISIGYFIHKYEAKIIRIPKWTFLVTIPIGIILFLLEKQFLTTNGFMVPILTGLAVTFSVAMPKLFSSRFKMLSNWGGAKYGLYMYIFHPLIIFGLNFIFVPLLAPANLLTMIAYWLLICVLSLLASIGFVKLKGIVMPKVKQIRKDIDEKVNKFLA